MKHPYAVPSRLAPDLARVQAYWQGLLRGGAEMPFADDVNLTDLPDLADRLLLIDVFDRPERFRFNSIGAGLAEPGLAGKFLDETLLAWPFAFLRTQCCATVESAAPTFLAQEGPRPYARLLLPLWGEGRTGLLLGAAALG